jgi:hypothetical protein
LKKNGDTREKEVAEELHPPIVAEVGLYFNNLGDERD